MEYLSALFLLLGIVVLFLIFRAAVLWYWKLDKIEEHLSSIRKSLKAIENLQGNAPQEEVAKDSAKWKA